MTYTTQMNAARAGIATKEMETVAAYEGMDLQKLMKRSRRRHNRHTGQQKS